MRIGNPLPSTPTTIGVTGVASPTTLTTTAPATLANGATIDIAPLTNQREVIVSNLDSTNALYGRDTAATTQAAGTRIGPLAVAVFTLNATLRLTNNSGATIAYAINQTGP